MLVQENNYYFDVLSKLIDGICYKEEELSNSEFNNAETKNLILKLNQRNIIEQNKNNRLEEFQDVLIDYAQGNYHKKASISQNKDSLDALGLTINITGEELESTDQVSGENVTLNKLLLEKESLLSEIHHRIKNNLQIISSLISLQSNKIDTKNIKSNFDEINYRIKSIALIHEMLYSNNNFQFIDSTSYVKKLTDNIFISLNNNLNVIIKYDLQNLKLNIDTAIPLGLILNEIITNSIKYAFPNNMNGELFISLKKTNNQMKLILKDNGIGLADNYDINNCKTLGLSLVTNLTTQLGAKLITKVNHGTSFEIIF